MRSTSIPSVGMLTLQRCRKALRLSGQYMLRPQQFEQFYCESRQLRCM
jgi:hypothetical protein